MNKLDKQIRELITWTYSQNTVLIEDLDLLVSQIKQSILKAIMDKKPSKFFSDSKVYGIGNEMMALGFNQGVEEFESVIKEVLSKAKK